MGRFHKPDYPSDVDICSDCHKTRPNTHNKNCHSKGILQLVFFSFGKKLVLYNPLFFKYYNLKQRMHTVVLDIQWYYKNQQLLHDSALIGLSQYRCEHRQRINTVAPACSVQLYPLHVYNAEEFSIILLRARDQYIKQSFYKIIVLPDDGLIKPETCMSLWFL